jgi:hypothetical protein
MMKTSHGLALFFGGLLQVVSCWRSEGSLPTNVTFASYVGKFCFDSLANDEPGKPKIGTFELSMTGRVQEGGDGAPAESKEQLFVAVYSDENQHWKRVRPFWDELTCKERRELATFLYPISNRLSGPAGQFNVTVHVRQEVRPRFWYFTFVNCGATVVEPLTFKIHALNELQGYEKEFSVDQTGSLALDGVFACLFACTVGAIFLLVRLRSIRLEAGDAGRAASPLLRLLAASAGCSALGCLCHGANDLVFAYDGRGVLSAAVLGTFWACMGKAALTILQILIAKGWVFLFTPEEQKQRVAIVSALLGVICVSVGCEIWEQYFHDQSTSFYLHESWPGYIILTLNVFLLAAAWHFLWVSYTKETEPQVRRFYTLSSVACGIYFASLPVVCILAELFEPWVRRKYVERVEISTRFVATAMLVLCLRPTNVSRLVSVRLKNRDATVLLSDGEAEDSNQPAV